MSKRLTIALDAMGGDNAPEIVVEGAAMALVRFPEVKFILFGDKNRISPLLTKHGLPNSSAEIVHTNDAVSSEERPTIALRQGKNSSMQLAINAVNSGEAAGIVSAGNTGALMAISKFVLRTIKGINRPAIAGLMPTLKGQTVILDLGANVDCSNQNLVQFALMGDIFSQHVLGIKNPKVGLLNVGAEEIKGNSTVRQTFDDLKKSPLIFAN